MTTPLYPTLQDVFNRAWTTLKARGFTRAIGAGGACMYRSPIGPCAIGACIPDDDYSFRLDIVGSVRELRDEMPELYRRVFGDMNTDWLYRLQDCHDEGDSPAKMETNLRAFATSYRLTIPEEVAS